MKKPKSVSQLRSITGLSQEKFAYLLGFAYATINRWENNKNTPEGFNLVVVTLFDRALQQHPSHFVVAELQRVGPAQIEILRKLYELQPERTNS